MYLISLTNYDYVWITLFFCAFTLIAYMYRRQNSTYQEFLTPTTRFNTVAFSGFGIIEIITAGMGGSYYGFNAIYAVIIAVVAVFLAQKVLSQRYIKANVSNFSDYIEIKYGKLAGLFNAVLLVILFVLVICLSMSLIYKSLHSLMGWNFGNSVFALFGISLIAIVVGGSSGVTANKLLNYSIIILAFLVMTILAMYKLGGFTHLVNSLHSLAIARSMPTNYFFAIPLNDGFAPFGGLLAVVASFYLLNFNTTLSTPGLSKPIVSSLVIRVLLVVMLVMPGIIAIATPVGGGIANQEIVTLEAQLPDGQTGYIVKAVDSKNNEVQTHPGLIPPLLNLQSNQLEKNKYDYVLSSIVTFRHYLPKPLMVLALLMLLAGFLASIADYLLSLARIIVRNILVPTRLISQYGEIGQLWALRFTVLSFGFIALAISNYLAPNFNLSLFVFILGSLILLPFAALLLLVLLNAKIGNIPLALTGGVASGVIYISVIGETGVLNHYILCGALAFGVTFLLAVVAGQLKK